MQNVFNTYLNYLEAERNVSPYTVRNYKADLMDFFYFLKSKAVISPADVDRDTLRSYLSHLFERGNSKETVALSLSAIRSFYRYLLETGILSTSPIPVSRKMGQRSSAFSLKLDQHLPDFLTQKEMEKLLAAPDPATPQGQRDRCVLELLYASGLRVSELASLDPGQINLESREIRVRGKGSKERMVLMGLPAAEALDNYLKDGRTKLLGRKKSQALLLNQNGTRLTARSIQIMLAKYAARVGISKRVHPHMLRHTFATHLLDGGADLKVVQELLGHAKLSSTQVYTHVTKSQTRKVYLSAHPMARQAESDNENAGALPANKQKHEAKDNR